MDKELRREIAVQVAMAVRDTLSKIEERWLTADELCQHFGMFTSHKTRWAYPMHAINQLIMDGKVKHLKVMKM